MRDVMELGRNVEITAQNKRLGASMRNKLLHLVVPGAPPVEAALSAAVGHVNAEELMGGRVGGLGVEKAKRKDGGENLKALEFAGNNAALREVGRWCMWSVAHFTPKGGSHLGMMRCRGLLEVQ
jgi:hypothetical protein